MCHSRTRDLREQCRPADILVVAVDVASTVTPHRRGVGPMTLPMLLQNTPQPYETRTGV